MVLISLKDYAKQNNITYEAVRQQVNRYAVELGDHIIRDGRQQFLDEEAVSFLDSKRQKNPVTIIQQSKDEEIEQLRREKEQLLTKIAALSEWKAEHAVAIAEANHRQQLLEAGEEKIKALEAQNADLSAENNRMDKETREAIAKAQETLDALSEVCEEEMNKRKLAEAYAAELAEYIALPFFKRLRTKKPVLKNLEEESKE